MIKPETGNMTKTNNVSLALIENIINKVMQMVMGSLKIVSKVDKKDTLTACTSNVIRDIKSPFLFSEK